MFFSMKRSLVVFVAFGLLTGLVGCGDSASTEDKSIEIEAKEWVTNHYISFWSKSFFQESDVENLSLIHI